MIMMNLGSKYISMDITKGQELLLKNPITRRITVFCILYVATRDIMLSCILLAVFIMITGFLLHEESSLSVWNFIGLPIEIPDKLKELSDEISKEKQTDSKQENQVDNTKIQPGTYTPRKEYKTSLTPETPYSRVGITSYENKYV